MPLLLLLACPGAALSAEPESTPGVASSDRSRWEPYVSAGLTIAVNEQSGEGASTVDEPIQGSVVTVSPGFSFALGVTTPEVRALPLDPRFFVSGAIIPTIAFERDIAKQGDPRGFVLPIQEAEGRGYPESAIDGQGSQITGQIQTLGWSADVGMEFTRELADRMVYVRPSFSWTRFSVLAEGRILRAFKPNYDPEPGYPRLVTLEDSETRPFDALGGGIEIGVDMGRRGRVRPEVFFANHFYGVMGDRTIGLSATYSDAMGTEYAVWEYGVGSFLWRMQLGFRIAWLGASP